jgi:hypothetical protein
LKLRSVLEKLGLRLGYHLHEPLSLQRIEITCAVFWHVWGVGGMGPPLTIALVDGDASLTLTS